MIRCSVCGLRLPEAAAVCPAHGLTKLAAPSTPPAEGEAEEAVVAPKLELDDYEVNGVLGRGGYGVVYRGKRLTDGVGAAIKVASAEQRGAAELLAHETEALLAVGTPIAPAIYDHGRRAGYQYIVMEMIQAPTLAQRLEQQAGPMPLARFGPIARALLDAVEVVHTRGLLHCDLKPENIFVLDASRVRLIDFGAAHELNAPAHAAAEPGVGTAEYMAPEQCEGRADFDVRTDVYALGILFYEMLSGAPPFWGGAADVREAQISRRPPRLSTRVAVAPELEEVVLHCLLKDPAQRYASVSALRGALLRALHEPSLPAVTEGGWSVVQPGPRAVTALARAGAVQPAAAKPRATREKRAVGLVFFESKAGVVQVTQTLTALGGQLAQASGSQYVGVFGHELGDNPARTALLAAQRLLQRSLCTRVLLDVAQVAIQVRPDGERRFLSTLFSRKDRYPQPSDPSGILLTDSAAEVLSDLPARQLGTRAGVLAVDLADTATEVTTFGTRGEALLGQDALLESTIATALRAIRSSLPSVLTFIAEPGLGKSLIASTLVQRFARVATEAQVFKLAGFESLGGATYPTLRDLLRQLLGAPEAPPADRGEAFLSERIGVNLGPQVWAAVALVLGWVPHDHPQVRQLSAAPGALRGAASRAAGQLLQRAAEARPVIVVLDDGHLADEAALDALEYATLGEARARICVAVFARPSLERARPTWGNRAAIAEKTTIAPLDLEATGLLVRRLLEPVEHVPEAVVKKLYERTQGIPRLLVELLRGLRRSGLVRRSERGSGYYLATEELDRLPDLPVVQWSTTREIEGLSEQLAGHARLASVFGGKFTVAELDGLLKILERDGSFTETQLDAAIGVRRLLDAGIVNRGPFGHIDFRHALLREGLYEGMPEPLRKSIHRAAYEMYRDARALPEEERLPRLALHAARSDLKEEAAQAYLILAERAQHRHAYLEAESMYERALENLAENDSGRISTAAQGRGLMRFRLGRLEDAMKDFARAREHTQNLVNNERDLELLLDEAMVADWLGDFPLSSELAHAAQERMQPGASELVRARVLMAVGRSAMRAGQYEECVAMSKEAAQRADRLADAGYETFVIALLIAGPMCALLNDFDEAEELLGRALHAAEERGDLIHAAAALNNRSLVWNGRRDIDRLMQDLQRVREITRQTGFAPLEFHAEFNLGEIYYTLGDANTARQHAERAGKLGQQLWGYTSQLFRAEVLLARVALYVEDEGKARALIDDVRRRQVEAQRSGQKDAELVPTDELLAAMVEFATRSASEQEWAELRERCRTLSADRELIEILEIQALHALRRGERLRGEQALKEAFQIATESPTLLMNRISRELKQLGVAAQSN